MSEDFSKPRVNASMLAGFQGRTVCLLGMAKDVRIEINLGTTEEIRTVGISYYK